MRSQVLPAQDREPALHLPPRHPPGPARNFLFHVAQIYVDDELNLPIRYEAYDWPAEEGGKPQLTEEYTYLNLKLNNGFTDADFDIRNPNYQFKSK